MVMSEEKIWPPSLKETRIALWVASYALGVVKSFIEKGRPDPDEFMDLCGALVELQGCVIGSAEFHERAEEIYQLELKQPPES